MVGRAIDETGKVYGTLRVLRRYRGASERTNAYWVCLCDPVLGGCGSETAVRGDYLRSGRAKNCGCKRGEKQREAMLRYWRARKEALK